MPTGFLPRNDVQGSPSTPITVVEQSFDLIKYADVASGSKDNTVGRIVAHKYGATDGSALSALYAKTIDLAGDDGVGANTFVEGGRFEGVLGAGQNGSAYGLIAYAGEEGGTLPRYLVGAESVINKRVDASPAFDPNSFACAFLATEGLGFESPSDAKSGDAAFMTNPFSQGDWRRGFFAPENTITDVFAENRSACAIGVKTGPATYAALYAENNAAAVFRVRNSANTADLNAIILADNTDALVLGFDNSRVRVLKPLALATYTVGSLPTPTAANVGWAEVSNPAPGKGFLVRNNGSQWTYNDGTLV